VTSPSAHNLSARLRHVERAIIEFIVAFSPWLAPAIPAYLVAHNAWRYLAQGTEAIDVGFVVVTALAVELVGLSAVHTATEFWTWNSEKRKSDDAAPFIVAAAAGLFYIVIVLLVNAVLEATGGDITARITAKALLSLLSVDAALIIALRSQHARRLEEIAESKAEKRAGGRPDAGNTPEPAAPAEKSPESRRNAPRFPSDWRDLTPEHKLELAGMSPIEIAAAAGVSDRSGREWARKLRENGFHHEES
jgi:hypothetical protein